MNSPLRAVKPTACDRKRKAESQENNERLSKRLSLLKIGEHWLPNNHFISLSNILGPNGHKLYPSVEQSNPSNQPLVTLNSIEPAALPAQISSNEVMHIDDTKHKVYIHDLDAELYECESEERNLVLCPAIKKRLLENSIPKTLLSDPSSDENNQLVLYSDPSSLTVAKEHDSVRRVIMESRARVRAQQDQQRKMGELQSEATPHSFTKLNQILEHKNLHDHKINSNEIISGYDPDAMELDT
ncbi:hypothetical protein (translation) [Blumeria hordei DH14]|uniref:Uncharacterized protein n=1 Tax=Blumeria graminis f. sp. hordei (strain DH14) TaxID=546991 RepID=N1JH20_BLUG1|nr:hypothetical protein (translation) [Blumeria hordei DH14]